MTDKSTWQKTEDRMGELSALHKRMDATRKLVYLEPFVLKDFGGTKKLDNVISVTGNQPAVFAQAIVSDLQSLKWQTVVEGEISSKQAHDIEQFVDDNFKQGDEVLLNRFGISGLYDWMCNHVCIRSLIGVRWIGQVVDKNYVIDCLPVDMRWTPYRYGKNGMLWVAPIFFSNREDLLEEYPKAKLKSRKGGIEGIEVRDYWDGKINEVWADGDKIDEAKNHLGEPPFVISFPSSGFMLRDKGYLEHEAEDIFSLNRQLYKEMNRALSIEQTLGMSVLYPEYEYEVDVMDSSPSRKPPKLGESQKVPKGERHQPVPKGDLNIASRAAREDIYRQIELGGISDAELGSAKLDRPGIWFAKQFEIRHKLERSRMEALASMKEGLARMMIKQFIESVKGGGEMLIGRTGRKNRFSVKMLGDPDKYRVSFKYGLSSKEMEIVNLAQGQAARGLVPDRIIIRDIIKADDPAGWERELALQKAKEANPAISLLEMACKYAEEANETEDETEADLLDMQARILLHDYVMMMRQRINPQPIAPAQEGEKGVTEPGKANMQGLASLPKLLQGGLMGGGGGRQPQPKEVIGG